MNERSQLTITGCMVEACKAGGSEIYSSHHEKKFNDTIIVIMIIYWKTAHKCCLYSTFITLRRKGHVICGQEYSSYPQ